jgi:RNA polymerase sigma-70 factor (ECF subfamily)
MPQPPDDHERFMRLFLEHEPQILRAVLVLVPQRADARDIVQETAVALWQHFSEYDPARPFVNWALGFARIQVRRFLRSGARRTALSENAAALIESAQDERAASQERRDAALRECLAEMPQQSRAILEGYYFEERTVEALAASHGRTVEATYKTLQRLRAALLDCINGKLSHT